MILVMMRPTVAPPRDTECVDIPGGPQTETFFTKDLPEAVSAALPGRAAGRELGHHRRLHRRLLRAEDRHAPPRGLRAGAGLSADYKAPIDPTTGDLFHGDQSCASAPTCCGAWTTCRSPLVLPGDHSSTARGTTGIRGSSWGR